MATTANAFLPENVPSFGNSVAESFTSIDSCNSTFIAKKKESEMLLNKNSPGASNISADIPNCKPVSPISTTATITPGAAAVTTTLSSSLSNSIRRSTQKSFNTLLQHEHPLGPAESVRVEEALPFSSIESEPLQIKKLFTPGRVVSFCIFLQWFFLIALAKLLGAVD